jgi:hypothetical protein
MNINVFGRRQMMKKVLVLLLIFALASLASAGLQISVNGHPEPPESYDFGLFPSEIVILDIWTDSPIQPGVGEGWWALVCNPLDGSMQPGVSVIPEEPGIAIYPGPVPALAPNPDGVYGLIALSTISLIEPGTTIYDDIIFHCHSPEDVIVTLWYGPQIGAWVPVDSVVIHQPEPMTIALLGLGGLFLRRRK